MSDGPVSAEHPGRIRRRVRAVRASAIGLGFAAVAFGVAMAALLGEPVWLLVSGVGLVWATGMVAALGSALKAAERPLSLPTAPAPQVDRSVLVAAPGAREARAFRLSHRFVVTFFGAFAVLMGLLAIPAFTARDGSVVVGLCVALFAAFMAWGAWRAARGRVLITGESVTTPGLFTTGTYSIADVDRVARGHSTGGTVSWPIAVLLLRSGRRVQLTPTAAWRTRRSQEQLDAVIREMNDFLGVDVSAQGDVPGATR